MKSGGCFRSSLFFDAVTRYLWLIPDMETTCVNFHGSIRGEYICDEKDRHLL